MNWQRKLLIPAVAILLLALVGSLVYLQFFAPRPHIYPGFGIALPVPYPRIGIDVSRHQGRIFWEAAARMVDSGRRISFVFIKATEGAGGTDRRFARNWEETAENGLVRGAYHYFHPAQGAAAQARHFLQVAHPAPGDLRPVLDVEVTEGCPPAALQDSICVWLSLVGAAMHTAPILYTHASFYNSYLRSDFADIPLWVAHYRAERPGTAAAFRFWQFSDRGRVNGIEGAVDFNAFAGSEADWQALLLPADAGY